MKNKYDIVIDFIRGVPINEIQEKYEISRATIYSYVNKDVLHYIWKTKRYCNKNREFINLLYTGLPKTKIARRLGISMSMFYKKLDLLKKHKCIDDFDKVDAFARIMRKIRSLFNKGYSIDYIAKKLRIDKSFTYRAVYRMKKHGLVDRKLRTELYKK